MICKACGIQNDDKETICRGCGASLVQGTETAYRLDADGYPILEGSGDKLGDKKKGGTARNIAVGSTNAIEQDLKRLRPMTRAAYYVVRSDNTVWINLGLHVGFVALLAGIVGVLILIYNKMNEFIQTSVNSGITTTGLQDIYNAQVGGSFSGMLWMIALLFVLVFAYIAVGRLMLRVKKVRRKLKRVEQKDMI